MIILDNFLDEKDYKRMQEDLTFYPESITTSKQAATHHICFGMVGGEAQLIH